MKTLLLVSVLFATPAFADATDDYVACLIGQSAVALNHGANDAEAAQKFAYEVCKSPALDENIADGLSDYVNQMVQKLAK